ncbi:YiiX family permuted papain-like enzyme [Flavobacterium sp. NKUCC04_CG]|uniref:YiiX family permuted papain-like enzyme n=1 Tax=Flavobacterium sp. NKUCC04_CG TaxID=2842121 RepID=UPI001C5AD93D|nr:YiiX family permuted papain-like enzyme [Flavobacterium sp. NKUCC04_CG]MBW3519663.1 YiiX family permuted papain-like enzyme [Flavobacterium sp. NKUCC04_CG]
MKKFNIMFVLLLVVIASSCKDKPKNNLSHVSSTEQTNREMHSGEQWKNGDVIFQTSRSSQSKAIQIATNSKYSHCGIIFLDGEDYFVFEAGDQVQRTPLKEWIARGEEQHFVVKRLKNADEVLTSAVLKKIKNIGEAWQGKDYDWAFEWSDDKIYCSELVWKMYQKTTQVELGQLKTLRDFDLTHPEVQKKLKERYGNDIPFEEPVIAPQDVFESENLQTVWSS